MAVTDQMVAPRYAKALFEVASSDGQLTAVHDELLELATVIDQNPDLLVLLAGKDLAAGQKAALLALLKRDCSPLVQNLVDVVFVNGRIGGLSRVIAAFDAHFNEEAGIVKAAVTTAVALSDQQTQAMRQAIAVKFDAKDVLLTQVVDPAVIGGVKIVSEDQIIDGTIQTRLGKLQKQLLTNTQKR
ncbi:ATP synthase F1 subunit delta [Lacticaseibacillus kribbianus]|uniref:ATP synthase F1 subunit delta n=1 Tax=Lacticaseibacillus kribbianus TaxID=2926292 RepID=UPI001CD21350|nr:ATP synthase F1 subunit delta [Lacticaseibacillus kribbianus]